jgi:WD40 repeat protein
MLPDKPPIFLYPKEVHLLNELNGKTITLLLPKEYTDVRSFKQGQYLTEADEKYFLWFNFGWTYPASSPDQNLFASVAHDKLFENGEIWCYDLPHRSLKWRYYRKEFTPNILTFSPDSKMLAAGGDSSGYYFKGIPRLDQLNGTGLLTVIDAKTGKLLRAFTQQTLWQQIHDRTLIAIAQLQGRPKPSEKKDGRHDNLHTYDYDFAPPSDKSEHVELITWSPDSSLLAAAYEDGSVKIWRVKEQ